MKNLTCLILLTCSVLAANAQCNFATTHLEIDQDQTLIVQLSEGEFLIEQSSVCLQSAVIDPRELCGAGIVEGVELWFRIDVSSIGRLHTTVVSTTANKPVWQLFTTDGASLQELTDCNVQNVSPEVLALSLNTTEQDIFLKVVLQNDEGLDSHDIVTVSSFLIPDDPACYGSDIHGSSGTAGGIELISREFGNLDNLQLGLGEEIEVRIQVDLQSTSSALEWFHGLFPMLGDGWDLEYFYEQNQVGMHNGNVGEWFDSSDPCAGFFNTGSPLLCTYVDQEGKLTICSRLTENCPCDEGVEANDPLPSGWFFTSSGNSSECPVDCRPSSTWGALASAGMVVVTLKLRVGSNPTATDFSIGLVPTTDQYTGCWSSSNGLYCTAIMPFVFDVFELAANSSSYLYVQVPELICSEKTSSLEVLKSGFSSESITLTFSSNFEIEGLPTDTIISTSPFIIPPLKSSEDAFIPFTVFASGIDTSGEVKTSLPQEVFLAPKLRLLVDSLLTCPSDCQQFFAETNWDVQGLVSFEWDDGTNGPFVEVCGDIEPTVTIIDGLNCDTLIATIRNISLLDENPEIIVEEPICLGGELLTFELNAEFQDPGLLVFWSFILGSEEFSEVSEGSTIDILLDFQSSEIDALFVSAFIIGGSNCEIDVVETFEVGFSFPLQHQELFCDYIEDEELQVRLPHNLESNIAISNTIVISDLFSVELIGIDADSLTLLIQDPRSGLGNIEIQIDEEQLCAKVLDYELYFLGDDFISIEYVITDFEVDFKLESLQGVTSVFWDFGDGQTSSDLFPTNIYAEKKTYQVTALVTTDCGVFEIRQSVLIAGTPTFDTKSNWAIYPNPASQLITFEGLSNEVTIVIFDIVGQEVGRGNLRDGDPYVMDVSGLAAGTYLVSIQSLSNHQIEKITIAR